jgi:hypothetical protein
VRLHLIIAVGLAFCHHGISFGQKLWDIDSEQVRSAINIVHEDTIREHLRGNVTWDNPEYKYASRMEWKYASATLLAWKYGESEREIILNSLKTSSVDDDPLIGGWAEKYYYYQFMLGFYGDQHAIAGMDTLARLDSWPYRYKAIYQLSLLGRFDHFGILVDAFKAEYVDWDLSRCFQQYGKHKMFRDSVLALFSDSIKATSDAGKRYDMIETLAGFDLPYVRYLLRSIVKSSTGLRREWFARELEDRKIRIKR